MPDRHKNGLKRPRGTGRQPGKDYSAHQGKRGVKSSKNVALTHLSRKELDDDEFIAALQGMRKESDRAAAIMGAALVEDGLTVAIGAALINDENEAALFHDQGAPFKTLSAKTIAAYAMGLCTAKVAAEIDIIRSIRNQFSHALRPLEFARADISAVCEGLGDYAPVDLQDGPAPDPTLPRFRFETACTGIWLILMRVGNERLRERAAKLRLESLRLAGLNARGLQG